MTTPSGLVRAIAFAKGIKPPTTGSFQHALLLDLDTRDRNLRLAEFTMLLRVLQLGLDVPEAAVSHFLELYEAELFQDLYVPAYQKKLRDDLRRKRDEAFAKAREQAAALKRVEAFEEKGAPFPAIRNGS